MDGLETIPSAPPSEPASPAVPRPETGGRRAPARWYNTFRGWLPGANRWRLNSWAALVPEIDRWGEYFVGQSDTDLRRESLSLRYQAKSGEPLELLLPPAYALVREAGARTLGMRHFPVQLIGGIALFYGSIAEMETGEGKTLTATLPLYLRALAGKGAHLATVNDYLARRDADWMRPIYTLLGMSVGVIETPMTRPQRAQAYSSDITYGTAKEIGFDFLRDRLLLRQLTQHRRDFCSDATEGSGDKPIQRDPYFSLVDEADSILIDEARTPLIISALSGEAQEQITSTYAWAAMNASRFEADRHYEYDHDKKKVELTAEGRQMVRGLPQPEAMSGVGLIDCYDFIERAIKVNRDFQRDQHYVVSDKGEIVIVDEFTGRLADGRKWRDGIHQAIEAKEHVEITVETGQAARITIQDLFLRYPYLAGMTGTASSSAREFQKIYKSPVVKIPTNRIKKRQVLPDSVFATEDQKWQAIVEEIVEQHRTGRPVLIGTRTIEKSQLLSQLLTARGIDHQVLNAHHVQMEAEIVAQAGQMGRVTVATNMAGRGTDIKLGPGVDELGGLHVICTEIHDSARIDRQLAGRCGRQGDHGTVHQFVSFDDDILVAGYGPKPARRLRTRYQNGKAKAPASSVSALFKRAQRAVERRHLRERSILLYHERERKKMHRELGQDPYLDTTS
ncbi:MAG: preprotein translocase subunit SecA [Pirellulales bacterium]